MVMKVAGGMVITREKLQAGYLQRLVAGGRYDTDALILNDDQLRESIATTLHHHRPEDPVRVFSYGSLIWNPTFHYTTRRLGRLYGYRRDFTLWVKLGRGSPDQPGLMLGLRPGGSCWGAIFEIAPDQVRGELFLVWRREMVTGAYRPTWVTIHSPNQSPCSAIAFTANPDYPGDTKGASEGQIIQALARATGQFGSSYEYLTNTIDGLAEMGVGDVILTRYRTQADKIRAS